MLKNFRKIHTATKAEALDATRAVAVQIGRGIANLNGFAAGVGLAGVILLGASILFVFPVLYCTLVAVIFHVTSKELAAGKYDDQLRSIVDRNSWQ